MGIIAADELLGNSLGVAQPVVLDELDVGDGVRVDSECLVRRGCDRAEEGRVEPVDYRLCLVSPSWTSRLGWCLLSRRWTLSRR